MRLVVPEMDDRRNCEQCGSDLAQSQIRQNRMYCSKSCGSAWQVNDRARFWAKVQKTDACWLWTGAPNSTGYGAMSLEGHRDYVHRHSYRLVNGPIPDSMEVDHKCHNRLCVRPDHLRVVTHTENAQNHQGAMRDSKSGIRGVWWSKQHRAWAVQVALNGLRHSGGIHHDLAAAEAAAIALRNTVHTHNDVDRRPAEGETVYVRVGRNQ